jgi:magnesium-transporting ATPase (P-type)
MEEIGMLGFVAFRNRIKSEAKQCIREMKSIDITTKVVTGDSVFLAVRVAFDTGIIDQQQKVTVIEGHRYDPESGGAQLVELTLTADGTIEQSVKRVDWFSYDAHGDDVYAIDH